MASEFLGFSFHAHGASQCTCAWGFHRHRTIATDWIKLQNFHPPRLDMCTEKILLVMMGARMKGQACADLNGRDLFSTAWRIESIWQNFLPPHIFKRWSVTRQTGFSNLNLNAGGGPCSHEADAWHFPQPLIKTITNLFAMRLWTLLKNHPH